MFSFFALQCGVQDAYTHTCAVAKWRTAPDPPTPRLSPHLTLPQFPPRAKTNHCSQPVSQPASRSAGRMPRPGLFHYFESSFPAVAALAVSATQDVPRIRSSFAGLHPLLALCYAPRRAAARALRLARCGSLAATVRVCSAKVRPGYPRLCGDDAGGRSSYMCIRLFCCCSCCYCLACLLPRSIA